MMKINWDLKAADLENRIEHFWELSAAKIELIAKEFDPGKGSPVCTVGGKYRARGWTDWTQGFQFGSSILQFDATGDRAFLEEGRKNTRDRMAPHLTHLGVHDHGFNNVSTYGNLLRLMNEGRIRHDPWESGYYVMALKVSGAIQASRWTDIADGGFIYSFNGPHSLFVDTIRSCRALILSHCLGHVLFGEGDIKIDLLGRAITHLTTTAKYAVFYGEGRDAYDVRGRTAHESIFNIKNGRFRCPNSQQGYSAFSTWTRGLAWAICGFAEQLEWFGTAAEEQLNTTGSVGKEALVSLLLKAATATSDFYIENSCSDGVPYWDTGAPGLSRMGDYLNKPADPYNGYEPVDSSAAAIAAQGLLRLGRWLQQQGDTDAGQRYWQAGLTVLHSLLDEPYLSKDPDHQGLVLHSIYHRPNGWDHIPAGSRIPHSESSQWGDYHIREAALYVQRVIHDGVYHRFFNICP